MRFHSLFPLSTALLVGGAGLACSQNVMPGTPANAIAVTPQEANGNITPSPADQFRSDVSLNGEWRFMPAVPSGKEPVSPADVDASWGSIKVPGSWMRTDDLHKKGEGPLWKDFDNKDATGRQTIAGWYETTIDVPETAKGRAVLIDFARVSTDAIVYVDGTRCGEVSWPEGRVDITRAVTWGKPMRLRLYIVSTADEGEVKELMGIIPGQNTSRKAERDSGGLIGAVTLQTRPKTARIEDVFVQTSTRKKELRVELSLGGLATPESVEVTARAVNAKGVVEKTFAPITLIPSASPGETGRAVVATWKWENPRLWDLEQPNLYTLLVSVKGAGIEDGISQPFGFREFWVKGRDLYLNGTPFRMRPTLLNTDVPGGWEEKSAFGFNIVELWPNGHERRTQESRHVAWYEYADARGIPLTGILPHMDWMGNNYSTPERAAALETQIRRDLRRYRNHPSIVMWGTSGNMMGATGNPKFAGLRDASRTYDMARSENLRGAFPLGQRGVDYMKSQDPTRPVFIHFGGAVGDLYTLNHYLIFTPLQEREEFISHWAKQGDMPLWYVEFGTPLNTSLFRGRNGFGNAMQTEPFLSEYCAIYQGTEAYRREPDAYRADIASKLIGDQKYQGWFYNEPINTSASFQELQKLFHTNTWRSYRTYGITGGMIPWDGGYLTHQGKRTPAGDAFAVANAPTLAWITGDKTAFTAKGHHYRTGQTLQKQIALLNDSRAPRNFTATWAVRRADGTTLGKGQASGKLAVGETRFLPVSVPLSGAGAGKTEAQITLEATIGGKAHSDTFAFRIFGSPPPLPATEQAVIVYDPAGKTSAMLTALGYKVSPWRGTMTSGSPRFLVVGREAFGRNGGVKPAVFESFVRGGGRLLILSQKPEYLRNEWGLRVAAHAARRVWPIPSPTVKRWFGGVDGADLRDWNGVSSLLAPYPDYVKGDTEDTKLAKTEMPYYGYRWGTRGSVSSVPIEKPHYGGWHPVFECEFDLAYSPLLTRRHGAGRVTLCTFDLEDHAKADPAAARLTHQIIRYAKSDATPSPVASVTYRGDEVGKTLLDSLGLKYTREQVTPPPPSGANRLLIIGEGADLKAAEVRAFARTGGRVLYLARRTAQKDTESGVDFRVQTGFHGSLSVPEWEECDGLSASDLRLRTDSDWVVCTSPSGNVQVGANGLLAREAVGTGSILYCQIDPDRLDADKRTYLRQTRWRQTRAINQIIANMGGTLDGAKGTLFSLPVRGNEKAPTPKYYHADYRADFDLGDNPYRFYNW